MNKKNNGWVIELIQVFPELPGIIILLIGIVVWYWSTKGNEWMYDTGGPGVMTNITWVRNTFGEVVAQRFNSIVSWGIMVTGVAFIALGVWLRMTVSSGKG